MAKWTIERLNKAHDRGPFTCGVPALDVFLKTQVTQYARRRLGQTYVATDGRSPRVLGFYTVSSGSFGVDALPEDVGQRLPRHPVPTLHLGRLAVDSSLRCTGLGKTLLFHFLFRGVLIADEIGVHAVDVIAMGEATREFYEKFGFKSLRDNSRHLYLPIATAESMFDKEVIKKRRREIDLP